MRRLPLLARSDGDRGPVLMYLRGKKCHRIGEQIFSGGDNAHGNVTVTATGETVHFDTGGNLLNEVGTIVPQLEGRWFDNGGREIGC